MTPRDDRSPTPRSPSAFRPVEPPPQPPPYRLLPVEEPLWRADVDRVLDDAHRPRVAEQLLPNAMPGGAAVFVAPVGGRLDEGRDLEDTGRGALEQRARRHCPRPRPRPMCAARIP